MLAAIGRFFSIRAGDADPTTCAGVAIIEDDDRTLISAAVGISKHIFIHVALVGEKVIQQKIFDLSKHVPPVQQRRDLAFMPCHQPVIGLLIVVCATVFHAVALGI